MKERSSEEKVSEGGREGERGDGGIASINLQSDHLTCLVYIEQHI